MEKLISYEDLKRQLAESGRSYDMELIDGAYALAEKAHSGVCRRSGEPYITHPLSVASLLIDLGLDSASISAALLHDVVEDTEVTKGEIASRFGDEVANLVDGVTKLGQISFSTMEEQQAENLRKMLLAMSQAIRISITGCTICGRWRPCRSRSGGTRPSRRWRSTPRSPTGWG